ncbi:MAG: hypothetical protein ACE5ES_01360 [Candidatus Nanoarchaeia archaeon]
MENSGGFSVKVYEAVCDSMGIPSGDFVVQGERTVYHGDAYVKIARYLKDPLQWDKITIQPGSLVDTLDQADMFIHEAMKKFRKADVHADIFPINSNGEFIQFNTQIWVPCYFGHTEDEMKRAVMGLLPHSDIGRLEKNFSLI